MWDSSIRDNRLYHSLHSRENEHYVFINQPSSQSHTRLKGSSPGGCWEGSRIVLQLNTKSRKSQSLYWASNKFYTGGELTLTLLNRKQTCFVFQVRTLFFIYQECLLCKHPWKDISEIRGQLLALKTCKYVNWLSTTWGSLYLKCNEIIDIF